MGLLDRLLGRKAPEGNEQGREVATGPCLHPAMGPRWDNADEMGDESKANSYRCEACAESFTPEQAEQIRAEGAGRLKANLSRDD